MHVFSRMALCCIAALLMNAKGAENGTETKTPMADAAYDFSPLDSQIQGWIEKGYYPGVSLLIVKDGHTVFEKCYGSHKADSTEYIASAGKWLAAATVMAVVDEGKLSLDDPASKFLPEFTDGKRNATLRQMFAHTSGYAAYQPKVPDNYQTLAESVKQLAPLPLEFEPGAHWNYGGLALQAGGRMAELASGKDWEALFQEKIAIPLHMNQTRFTPVDVGFGHTPMLGGGARSALHDYGNFLAMISSGGMFEGKRILSEKAIAEMQADQVGKPPVPPGNFVTSVLGAKHNGVYGLGEWRESEDAQGRATIISSPSWAGTYPWIDKPHNLYGIFLAHVNTTVAGKDKFNPMNGSATLPRLAAQAIDAGAKRK